MKYLFEDGVNDDDLVVVDTFQSFEELNKYMRVEGDHIWENPALVYDDERDYSIVFMEICASDVCWKTTCDGPLSGMMEAIAKWKTQPDVEKLKALGIKKTFTIDIYFPCTQEAGLWESGTVACIVEAAANYPNRTPNENDGIVQKDPDKEDLIYCIEHV